MNAIDAAIEPADRPVSSFTFTGSWRDYLPIAATNFLLILVTLGIYRFWAKARERRYLWSRTHFIDDTFEWTGTGKEMLIGFLIVLAVFVPLILILNLFVEGMMLRGEWAAGIGLTLAIYAGLFYFFNVGRVRALRYRLSRTYWHGIRGGSDDSGWRYGATALWKGLIGVAPMGLLLPWTMANLWNERWRRMSFGPHPFEADAQFEPLMKRWVLIYIAPIIILPTVLVAAYAVIANAIDAGSEGAPEAAMLAALPFIILAVLLFYVSFAVLGMVFYAKLYRTFAAATSVAGIEFGFTARTWDWVKLILGHAALVIGTLGFGLLFISYRNHAFVVRHLEAYGLVDLDLLTQSETRAPGDAEGLAEAFDFGAF